MGNLSMKLKWRIFVRVRRLFRVFKGFQDATITKRTLESLNGTWKAKKQKEENR